VRADWVATRAPQEHKPRGAVAHPLGAPRCEASPCTSLCSCRSLNHCQCNLSDPKIWKEGDGWAVLTSEVQWNGSVSGRRAIATADSKVVCGMLLFCLFRLLGLDQELA
jgi:hypothetical protein